MSLEFENVSFAYAGAQRGIAEVSLSVGQGELLAVMGRSGSGKSTILRLTAGLLNGYRGRIAIHGNDMAGVPVWQREVGMVFQQYAIFPHLNVLDNVAYGLRMRGVGAATRRARALEMLERVGLAEYAERRPTALSGGQQQRVALARALVFEPRILLLDEPLAALDAGIRQQLRDQIRTLQRACNATTLLVTHDQEEALSIADRVAVVDDGRILQVDTPQRLYDQPASARVARFVGHSSVMRGHVLAPGSVDVGFAMLSASTGTFRIGEQVDVLVRPEHVQADPLATALNRIGGRRGEVRYFGATSRYDFIPQGSSQRVLCEGRQLAAHSIAIAPEHLRVLPPSDVLPL
ncbi:MULTISPECIES: ABC transporter ATP-binding protein [Ralstonia solanacearum species complex]|uniref:ABC transporter ATP-binding protein n=1 Tax=Ralstonia solanacearum TaxID=305 RepID=A0AAD0SDS0_RALSL|nr:ABC transporter ATP-binding protein [Ralstonia solanacearum]BEU71859.1 ABC transporter ATP-binding protein [Ralstonia pseudosolanacearum]AMP37378.1 ABC transporter ATP-binding protein [Ralstonia solanacearum]AXV76787.1 ABC transporter ATP-binding protein [Ralstonia solanacearum]AXV81367.1 ABC transporter ATP-binding protein [Ralstonia solanacearum]AXV86198.1 ABC transporter ATP-binding protein [Ralstonia solanacearum]